MWADEDPEVTSYDREVTSYDIGSTGGGAPPWPPRVRTAEMRPARAQRVTVLGLTRDMAAPTVGDVFGSASLEPILELRFAHGVTR